MYTIRRFDKLQSYDLWLNGVLAAATIGVVTVAYLVAFLPLNLQFYAVRAEIEGFQKLIQKTSDITQTRQTLEAELAKSQKGTAELLQRIPTAPRESDFLAQVCQLADHTGMEVADYHPRTIEKRENHQEMEVHLSTRGDYQAICQFLEQVEHLPRLCRLTQLEIGSTVIGSAVAGSKLPVEMTFRIYFAPPGDANSAKKG
jgi:Tfp pilus assembly protein PilO